MRTPVERTSYLVHADPVYGSPRWRYVITTDGVLGAIVVSTSQGTYEAADKAVAAGVAYAGMMARQLRKEGR